MEQRIMETTLSARVPNEVVKRFERLAKRMKGRRELAAAGQATISAVLRLVLVTGIAALEKETAPAKA